MIKPAIDIIGRNLLPAIAYGDAAGLPVETRDAAYIRDWYGSVNALLRTTENPFYKGEYEAGTWSDDTQLSLAVARSVIKANGFDMQALADEHVAAYGTTPQVTKENGQVVVRGWGRSTTLAVQRYMRGIPIEACGQKNSAGNGVVMKMAPLALLYIALETDKAEVYRHLDACTQFTHDSLVAKVASRVHYDALNYLVRHPLDQAEFGHHVYVQQSIMRVCLMRVLMTLLLHYNILPKPQNFRPKIFLSTLTARGFMCLRHFQWYMVLFWLIMVSLRPASMKP